jgi:hypothetical protein
MFEVAEAIAPPQFLLKLFPSNQLPWTGGKDQEDLNGLTGQLYGEAVLTQFLRLGVEFEGAETD